MKAKKKRTRARNSPLGSTGGECVVDAEKKFVSIRAVKACVSSCGSTFFSRQPARMQVPDLAHPDGTGGAFFVTSEQDPRSRQRRYTVRRFRPSSGRASCRIELVTALHAYEFGTQARNVAIAQAAAARRRASR